MEKTAHLLSTTFATFSIDQKNFNTEIVQDVFGGLQKFLVPAAAANYLV